MDFIGSDWCGWCIAWKKEVFSQAPFKTGVKDKFVLVEVDFPKDKSKLSAETIKQNTELGQEYGIHGYPTVLLCDATGKPYAVTGYKEGGPTAYLKELDRLRTHKLMRDHSFQVAEKAQGLEKAKALVASLTAMGLNDKMVLKFYGDIPTQIKEADPKDETGFAKREAFKTEHEKLLDKNDHEGILVFIDKALKDGVHSPEENQEMMISKVYACANLKRFPKAIKAVDQAKAFAPRSAMLPKIDKLKQKLMQEK